MTTELTIQQIYDYMNCPYRYKLKYIDKIEGKESKKTMYSKAIHKSIYFYYYTLMNNRRPSGNEMKNKWSNMWKEAKEGGIDVTKFLLEERPPIGVTGERYRDRADKYSIQGYEAIHLFQTKIKDENIIPIAVDYPYRVIIEGIPLVGNFEVVQEKVEESGKRFMEIIDFKTSTSAPSNFDLHHDLSITASSYAFRTLFKKEEDRNSFYYAKTGTHYYTKRNELEYERLKKVVYDVANQIAREQFYPRQSFMCNSCPLMDVCNKTIF